MASAPALSTAEPPVPQVGLPELLARVAPQADPEVIRLATRALACASRADPQAPTRLTVIDYSLPSTRERMWVFDLAARKLLYSEKVAHGQASGEDLTRHFSNAPGSRQTSLGLFRTAEPYVGNNGYSLRLDGLEPGVNDRARERAIVIHGAPYVSNETIAQLGRLGRSWGCPAVRSDVARKLIDEIKGGQYVFSYYPDESWLRNSQLLNCPG